MPSSEESKLIINIDKNLEVLIHRFDQEIKSNDEFKAEIKETVSDTQKRLRIVEDWKSKTEVKQEGDKFMKQVIIRWVVANLLTTVSAIAGAIYILLSTKGP